MTSASPNALKTMNTIEAFISQVGGFSKSAAAPLSEPGSVGGPTSHPVKNVDDRLSKATEGARSAENEKDVKEDQGAAGVDSIPIAKSAASLLSLFAKRAEGTAVSQPGSAADDHLQIGLNVQPTGEDPAHETSSAKGGKEDGGTITGASTHPARTDNDELDGGKYASDLIAMPLEKLASEVSELGNSLLADLAVIGQFETKSASTALATQVDPKIAHRAGWDLAALAASGQFDKKAADALVEQTFYDIVKSAFDEAHLVADHLVALAKHAEEGPPMGGPPPGGDPGAMMGGPPPGGDPMGGAGGPPPGAGGPPPGAGGPPPGGDPMGGAGGPPPGAGGDPQMEQLVQMLIQSGISPEQLTQMIAQSQTGSKEVPAGAGGPPPGAGGPPPGGDGGAEPKSAAAKPGHKEAQMLEALTELLARSRAGK